MRVALISTDNEIWALGMRIVSSVLRKAGYHTRIITMAKGEKSYSDNVLEEVKELVKDSDIIGLSCLSRGSDKAHQVISSIRPLGKPIIWGGLHATICPEDSLKAADVICRGEGEETVLELLERLETGKDWRDLPNLAYKNNGTVVMNPLRPLISDLDSLPFIDVSYLDEFHLTTKGIIKASNKSIQTEAIVYNGARGCANSCTYCTNAKLKELFKGKGNYLRKISVSKNIEHTKKLKEIFPKSSYFFFADEDFFTRSLDEWNVINPPED